MIAFGLRAASPSVSSACFRSSRGESLHPGCHKALRSRYGPPIEVDLTISDFIGTEAQVAHSTDRASHGNVGRTVDHAAAVANVSLRQFLASFENLQLFIYYQQVQHKA